MLLESKESINEINKTSILELIFRNLVNEIGTKV